MPAVGRLWPSDDDDDDDNDLQVVDKQQVGRENMWQGWPLGAGASKV